MNVNAVSFEEHGAGYAVTIRMYLSKEEVVGDYRLEKLSFNLLKSHMMETEVSRETADNTENPTSAPSATAKGRRRGRPAAPADAKADETADGSAEGLKQDQESSEEEKPASVSRRRRRSKAADPIEKASTGAKSAASVRKRTRKAGAEVAETKSPSEEDEIFDSDLSKAASLAASDMDGDIDAVMKVLEEFGVSKVGDIATQDVRREFLNKLQEVKNDWMNSR